MSKYLNEFKLEVVQYYNEKKLGIGSIAKYFNIIFLITY